MKTVGYLNSSSFFIGGLFTCLLLLGIYLVSYFIGISGDNSLISESVAAIDADIQMFSEAEELAGFEHAEKVLAMRLARRNNGFFYALRDKKENWLMGNIKQWPSGSASKVVEGVIKFDIPHADLNYKSPFTFSSHFDVLAKVHTFQSGHQLIVGRDVDALEIFKWVGQTFGWVMIGIIVLISCASILMSYYVVTRINQIADISNNIIETGNLSERIPVVSQWDDLSKLAVVLNRLFAELEMMVQSVRSVSDNIAHDLRTPLTRLRGDLESVKDEDIKASLMAETDNILGVFDSLLRIADIEAERRKEAFESNDIGLIANDVVDLFRPLAREKNIVLSSEIARFNSVSDRNLLFQAFANILDNAIKFTPKGGLIAFCLRPPDVDNLWHCSVCDSGIGISEADREKVIQRFYRVDKSRHMPGNGLGLPLVNAIVQLHGGQLVFANGSSQSTLPGLCCSFACPVNR